MFRSSSLSLSLSISLTHTYSLCCSNTTDWWRWERGDTGVHHNLCGLGAFVPHIKMAGMCLCCHLKLLFYCRGHISLLWPAAEQRLHPFASIYLPIWYVCILTVEPKADKVSMCYRLAGIAWLAPGLMLFDCGVFLGCVQSVFYRLLFFSSSEKTNEPGEFHEKRLIQYWNVRRLMILFFLHMIL